MPSSYEQDQAGSDAGDAQPEGHQAQGGQPRQRAVHARGRREEGEQ